MFNLIYTSRSVIPPEKAALDITGFVQAARVRNRNLDVTGCLIFSAGRFAQILEGEQPAVEELMRSISRDERHVDVAVLEEGSTPSRRFAGWSLGYAGPSLFVQRTISMPSSTSPNLKKEVADLVRLLVAFHAEAGEHDYLCGGSERQVAEQRSRSSVASATLDRISQFGESSGAESDR